jgi:hypothetical protein
MSATFLDVGTYFIKTFRFPLFYCFPDEMVSDIYVFCPGMKLIILRYCDSPLIVCKYGKWSDVFSNDFFDKTLQLNTLFASMSFCYIFGLGA